MPTPSAVESCRWRLLGEWRSQRLPTNWELPKRSYGNRKEGVRILEGATIHVPLRGAFCDLRVRIDGALGKGAIGVGLDNYSFGFGSPESPVATIGRLPRVLAATAAGARCPNTPCRVQFQRLNARLAIQAETAPALTCADPLPNETVSTCSISLPKNFRFFSIRIEGKRRTPHPPRTARRSPTKRHLDVCVDFYDDLCFSAWNEDTFEAAFRFYKSNGIRRVYFIYHGAFAEGFWDQAGKQADFQNHIDSTFRSVGEFLPAFVRHGNAWGMDVFAVLKPFESAMFFTFPEGSRAAQLHGKISGLGGRHWWSPSFTASHPRLRIARKPAPLPADPRVGSIVLTAEAGFPCRFKTEWLQLWTSPDNGCYSLYTGPLVTRQSKTPDHTIVLDGIRTSNRFFAISMAPGKKQRFGNTLRNLLRIRDPEGRELPVTFSTRANLPSSDFREHGFAMDCPGLSARPKELDDYCLLDDKLILGFAAGVESYLQGALCPGYTKVRDWWVCQIKTCIAAGVKGVDIRIKNHNRTFDWDAFGFTLPVVKEFKRRYGIDIRQQEFDRQKWRVLRGEFFDQFLRAARATCDAAKILMNLHVEPDMNPSSWHSGMEMHFDWQKWIGTGLPDEITLKMFGTTRSSMARAVARACQANNIPVNFCPSLFGINFANQEDLVWMAHDATQGRCDSWAMYQNSLLMSAKSNGSIELTRPWIPKLLSRHFRQ